MPLSRRTFLALSGAAAGSRVVPSFAEQIDRAAWDGRSPLFVAAGIESYTASLTPTGAKSITDTLGSAFEIVRGDTFFQMLHATQGTSTS